METNYEKDGIYLSRDYYNWLMEKNDELTDRYVTFGELFKAFSNSKYKRFIQEQNLMENEFFYKIRRVNDCIVLERSYDLVFVPYDMPLAGCDAKNDVESTDDFLVSYSNLCQNGRYPSKCARLHYGYISNFLHSDYLAYDSFTKERERLEKYMGLETLENTLKLSYIDYAMAEENGSYTLKCDFESQLARRIEANIIRHLMDEAERLYLVNRKKKLYELRLLAFAGEIILLSTHGYNVGRRIPIRLIQEHVNTSLNILNGKDINLTLPEMCKKIREVRKENINLRVSDTLTSNFYDYYSEGMIEFFDCDEEEEIDEFYLEDDKMA